MSLTKRSTTAANASLISTRSMSSMVSPALASALRVAGAGPVSMMVGLGAGDGGGDDPGARGEPVALADLLGADGDQRGAVHDAGGVARVVDVVDLLDPVVLLQRHGVEAAQLADVGEGRLQPGQGVGGGAGAQVLVVVEDDQAVAVPDRDDGPLEAARPSRPSAARSCDSAAYSSTSRREKPSMVAMRSAPMPCGTKPVSKLVIGSVEPGAAVGGHRHPGHRLDAAGEDQVLPAGTDLGGGQVDGFQARGTEAVLLDAGDRVGQSGGDRGDPGDVGALVADRADDAEHDVVDGGRVQAGEAARGARG